MNNYDKHYLYVDTPENHKCQEVTDRLSHPRRCECKGKLCECLCDIETDTERERDSKTAVIAVEQNH